MATTKVIAIGTTTTIAATGVVGYGVSQVVGSSSEETPNSNPEREVVTSEKITNRKKITDSKFTIPSSFEVENCQERLNAYFEEVNDSYKQLIKECFSKTTFKGRVNLLSLNSSPKRDQDFSKIEEGLSKFSKLKEKFTTAKGSNSNVNLSITNSFCYQVGQLSLKDFQTTQEIENSWAKYLEICSTSQPKNFWAI